MRVALFVTCLTDAMTPRVGEAVVRVLRHFGCEVDFPSGQTCCGQPAYSAGFHADAAAVARRMIDVFREHAVLVTPSASCAAMVRSYYPELFADEPHTLVDARRLGERTFEFAEFLRERLGVDPGAYVKWDGPVTFHYPCHARKISSVARVAADLGPSAAVRTPKRGDLCCGFGGVFATDYPEISAAMARDKLAELSATGAGLVVCNEGGCGLHLAGAARRMSVELRFKHLAECMAESLGLMGPA